MDNFMVKTYDHERPYRTPVRADRHNPRERLLVMTSRQDVHRLLDAVPDARLPALEQILRASLDGPPPAAPRRFTSAGTLSAEHDLAERSEDILRRDATDAA